MHDESGTAPGGTNDEVWLRGNVRPVAAFAVLALVLAVAAVGIAAWRGGGATARWTALVVSAVVVPDVAAFAFIASRPRLRQRGDVLEVRLSPFTAQRVPLGVVECVFPGSRPLPRAGDAANDLTALPDRRVTTVIIRLAERAGAWRERPTFTPWGTWEDGHIVVDGRWTEPLSPQRIRDLAARLIEARQGRAGDCGGSMEA